MWGPGAEQGGILQTSSGKLDLKEPYYRLSQPQSYTMSQEQQPQTLLQTQVLTVQQSFELLDALVGEKEQMLQLMIL